MEETMSNDIHESNEGAKPRIEKGDTQEILRVLHAVGIHEITRKQWDAIRQVPGQKVDPDTADVMWVYADTVDYRSGICGVPVREYFARASESKEWVRFGDLPQATRLALVKKHRLFIESPDLLKEEIREELRLAVREALLPQGTH
jgi:hypothetical protein